MTSKSLKRVPPLNCHVEISNGLSVPLSWNSWSRTSRTRGAHPLTTRSAPFWALLFSNHAQCLVHQYKLNISHFLLDCISFELCLPFVVLHQLNELTLRPRRRAHHLHLRVAALIIFFAPPCSSSLSLRRRAHHHHLRVASLITFLAPPRSSSSSRRCNHHAAALIIFFAPLCSSSLSLRRHAHHLHLRVASLITFLAPPRSSSSSRRRNHHASVP